MEKIVFATANAHKLSELRAMLAGRFEVVGLPEIGCTDDIPETADTFAGNALQKAQWILDRYPYDCVAADDSGLEVDALGGEPGVRSARFAGDHNSVANNALLLFKLEEKEDPAERTARFRTVIALARRGAEPIYFDGAVEGHIIDIPRGNAGFGYDPLFVPEGWDKTFAEATPEEKNAISHRGRAVAKLVEYLSKN